MPVNIKIAAPAWVKRLSVILTLILFFKIVGYFSLVEDRTITQIFKIFFRIGMTVWILLILRRLVQAGCISNLEFKNILAPILYTCYLILGLVFYVEH